MNTIAVCMTQHKGVALDTLQSKEHGEKGAPELITTGESLVMEPPVGPAW
jgi:hypothetical protein